MTINKQTSNKSKKKRASSLASIDFLTPLSARDCIEHLESGRTPFKDWNLTVHSEGDHFMVGLVEKEFRRSVVLGGRGPNYVSGPPYSWTGSTWIDGTLSEDGAGLTRVTGQVEHDLGVFALLPWIVGGFVSVALLLLVAGVAAGNTGAGIKALIAGLAIAGLVYGFYYVETTRARRFGQLLKSWFEDRLDVQRTK